MEDNKTPHFILQKTSLPIQFGDFFSPMTVAFYSNTLNMIDF